ncbi:bifunctional diaminohydroxyphosphoribosylaminopyrimidine deaminase/5-amino-6-(5-phosphoribosylamino)uracil reductase RibD [Gaoshiqia sediminis]|uniref:Riboflavin biosynthesis protein RibD n=1 Tax=Gaoshiqia sediminis TaxID=2986998 RepID=A0AA41Y5X6_9BACT|nr:bifunctional diaminohydroxyphosphoribosylaminopyrimidine deaminase/5-amino-6-(5-phosphoribosylamino)uracil reductase RibD [Gaoshiqia sediminis]MCW0484011.1 bifunctional diaminohydroxyphosphoribosylaminopyrimidine deaminase/5-amino-6-(5-phosphoribosylamino)uracil reductase RibD [Gaoshiqia sediminis]
MKIAEKYMERCISLARLGSGEVAPNPMVGSVIVCNDLIIGEGFHRQYGGPHAEVNAINSVKDKSLLKESTIYVSLEPCAHFGKTPPCSDLIISHRIPRVVVGSVDPFAKVAGKGIEKMRRAGIQVEVGVLEDECLELNRRFFTFHQQQRPYVILKWAQTLDGFLDIDRSQPEFGQPTWISNELSRRLVHRQRTEEAAILIGTNTAMKDNPSLTVRDWSGRQPVRLVIDRQNLLPDSLHLKDGTMPTIVFTDNKGENRRNLEFVPLDFSRNILPQLLDFLYARELQSVVVEGGKLLLQSFIDQDLWDEAHVYVGHSWFGNGVPAPHLAKLPRKCEQLHDTILQVFYRQN